MGVGQFTCPLPTAGVHLLFVVDVCCWSEVGVSGGARIVTRASIHAIDLRILPVCARCLQRGAALQRRGCGMGKATFGGLSCPLQCRRGIEQTLQGGQSVCNRTLTWPEQDRAQPSWPPLQHSPAGQRTPCPLLQSTQPVPVHLQICLLLPARVGAGLGAVWCSTHASSELETRSIRHATGGCPPCRHVNVVHPLEEQKPPLQNCLVVTSTMEPPGQSESWQHSWHTVGLEAQYLPMMLTVPYLGSTQQQTHSGQARACEKCSARASPASGMGLPLTIGGIWAWRSRHH